MESSENTLSNTDNLLDSPGSSLKDFGQWLKNKRLENEVSIEEIAAVTKIHIKQLQALENGDREQLPALTFVRGFLISYSAYLKLSDQEVLSHFKQAYGSTEAAINDMITPDVSKNNTYQNYDNSTEEQVNVVVPPPFMKAPGCKDLERDDRKLITPKTTTIAALVIAAGIFFGWLASVGKNSSFLKNKKSAVVKKINTVAPQKSKVKGPVPASNSLSKAATKEKPAIKALQNASPAISAQPTTVAAKKHSLYLKSQEETWISLRLDHQEHKGQTLTPNKKYHFEADKKVVLSLSNAGSVEINWNGTWYQPPGFRGNVMKLSLPDDLGKLQKKVWRPRTPATTSVEDSTLSTLSL